MSSSREEIKPIHRYFVVAKHDFYLDDARKAFAALGIEIEVGNRLEVIRDAVLSQSGSCTVFVPHYSNIIDLKAFPGTRFIGFHTGNLPKDRGGSPIQNKIVNKEYQTYVSAIALEDKIDSGAIYTHRKIDLSEGDIEFMLRKISLLISSMMTEIAVGDIKPTPQIESFEPNKRLTISDSELPKYANINELYDRIRMVDGLDYPNAFIKQDNYKVYFTKVVKNNGFLSANAIFESSD
jgi:methionyl-tRNA formyltransferase